MILITLFHQKPYLTQLTIMWKVPIWGCILKSHNFFFFYVKIIIQCKNLIQVLFIINISYKSRVNNAELDNWIFFFNKSVETVALKSFYIFNISEM